MIPVLALVVLLNGATAVPAMTTAGPLRVPLGVSYGAWRGGYASPAAKIQTFKDLGFGMIAFVPAYVYQHLGQVDLASGPDWDEFGVAVETALRAGLQVVIKPHLDPPLYQPGYDPLTADNVSWRAQCGWRGFFDLDPLIKDYREGVVFGSLRMIAAVLGRLRGSSLHPAPIRLELGVELMNSVVQHPAHWERLLREAQSERHRLGLDGQVHLSHNFSHHVEILEDVVGRLDGPGRRALARYIRGLDAIAVSQYMDLTAAMPQDQRGRRLPTAEEVAQALLLHERNFRTQILEGALELRPDQVPPLHIGEFGIGSGGLRHPNLWGGALTAEQEKKLAAEIARGHEGLIRYLSLSQGRTAASAILWVTGLHYDIFGWGDPRYRIPAAAAAVQAGLRPPPP